MKPVHAVVPVLLLVGFAAVYTSWAGKKEREVAAEKKGMIARANQAKEDFYSGKAFIGRNGKKEAEVDLSRGAPKLFLYGKTRADVAERTAIFKQRFGVELDTLAGCIVSEPLVSFATDYNAVIRSHIAAKFGATAFEEADREAIRIWERKRKKEADQSLEPKPARPSP
jgi:hypothetical protein